MCVIWVPYKGTYGIKHNDMGKYNMVHSFPIVTHHGLVIQKNMMHQFMASYGMANHSSIITKCYFS